MPEETPQVQPLPPWEDVKDNFAREFPNVPEPTRQSLYEQAAAQRRAQATYANGEPTGQYFMRRSVPGVSSYLAVRSARWYQEAKDRIAEGKPEGPSHSVMSGERPSDYDVVAQYEQAHQFDQQRSTAGQVGSALAHVPAMVGEALAGGAAMNRLAPGLAAAPNLVSRAAIASPSALGMAAARTGAQTALMPSMWAPQWVENNTANGRDATDPRGLPAAFALGYLNTAVLGSLTGPLVGNGGQNTIRAVAGRLLARTAIGMVEQQGVDIMASSIARTWDAAKEMDTHFGLIGGIIEGRRTGNYDPVIRHAIVQGVTFAAFSVMHGMSPHEAAKDMRDTINEGARRQLPTDEIANSLIQRMQERATEAAKPKEAAPAGRLPGTEQPKLTPEIPPGVAPREQTPTTGQIPTNPAPEALAVPKTAVPREAVAELERRGLVPIGTSERISSGRGTPEDIARVERLAPKLAETGQAAPGVTPPSTPEPTASTPELARTPAENRAFLEKAAKGDPRLNTFERRVLSGSLEGKSFEEIGKSLGRTGSRAQQIEQKALEKLGKEGSVHELVSKPEAQQQKATIDKATSLDPTSRESMNQMPQEIKPQTTPEAISDAMMREVDAAERAGKPIDDVLARYAKLFAEHEKTSKVAEDITTPEIREMFLDGRLKKVAGGSGQSKLPEFFQKQVAWVKEKVAATHDAMAELGGSMFPRTKRLSEKSADAISHHVAADVFVDRAAPYYIDRVLGKNMTPENARIYGSVFAEMRFRYAKRAFETKAAELFNAAKAEKDPKKRAGMIAESAKYSNAANDVRTFVGRENSGMQSEADFQRLVNSPEMKGILERWRSDFVPVMEKFFRKAEGLEESDPIERLTQMPDLPFSMRAIRPGDPTEGTVTTGGGQGNLKNPTLRKLGAAKEFTGSSEGYHVDLRDIIRETLSSRVGLATKADMYRILESEGLAKWGPRSNPIEGFREIPNVNPPRGTQVAEGKEMSLYVKDAAYPEVRKALAVDAPWSKIPGTNLASRASLMSLVEAMTHAKNLGTAIFQPGVNPVDVARNAWKSLTKEPAMMKRLVDLAEMGAAKQHGMESREGKSILDMGGNYNPLNLASKFTTGFLEVVDHTMRTSMEDAFSRLAKQGRVKDTEANKRDFINQALGQYNKKGQAAVIALLRETGIGPFATAGSTYTMQGLRSLTASPGVEASSYGHAVGLRAEKLARMAVVLAAAPILNYMMWGQTDGDRNTPIGALKVGVDNGKTQYIDLAALTGIRRGARLVGLNALAEGSRAHTNMGDTSLRAAGDFLHGVSHPAEGPAVQFATTAFTGHNTIGMPLTKEHSLAANLQAAVMNANPVVASLSGADRPGRPIDFWEKFWKNFGPFGVKYSQRPPGAPIGSGMTNRYR